jgi:alpha-L-arabinofuranosidase
MTNRIDLGSCAWLPAAAWLGMASLLADPTATITIEGTQPGPALSPRLYGIFLEEINHGVDGGLYAELVANRAFEDGRLPEGFTLRDGRYKDEKGYDSGFEVKAGEVPHWSAVPSGGARATLRWETSGGLNEKTPSCLRVEVPEAGGAAGVANDGFWGIGVQAGAKYSLRFHARGTEAFHGPLSVRLEDEAGNPCSSTATFDKLEASWTPCEGTLKGTRIEPKARLVITTTAKGTFWLDFVSLFPAKTWKNHGLRPDLAQMIADLKPGFVRFPGGCVVEGGTVETAYNWKYTVGPVEERTEQWGAWSYRRTHGLGFHEYLQFCEDLGAEPLHVGFAGQTCLFREAENLPMAQMGWVVTNFLDAVEYANGPASTTWGGLRARMGHPKPFGLQMVEIGNENGTPAFPERYQLVHRAMKRRYPDLKYIADLSWISRELMKDASFDIEDNHYYNSPQWFMNQQGMYDQRDRRLPPVYLGEVAVTSAEGGDLKGNLIAALGEGVYLMGCERNADVIRMISYAPLLAHVDGRSGWHGMIYHDSTRAFGTASYYLWQLFAQHRPDHTLKTGVEVTAAKPPPITGAFGVGTWETSAEYKDIRVERDGQVLWSADFSKGSADWTLDGGKWSVVDGAYRQSDNTVGLSFASKADWSNCTLRLKARKLGGAEGFLIGFGRSADTQYWWNIGGWGNHEHAIECNRSPIGRRVRGQIETGRWYDVRIELADRRIRCYLDDRLIHDQEAPTQARFYALAGRDETAGEVVLKVVNTGAESVRAALELKGMSRVAKTGRLVVLRSERLEDNNSFEQPKKVAPVEGRVPISGARFNHEFPAHSLSILRVKAR